MQITPLATIFIAILVLGCVTPSPPTPVTPTSTGPTPTYNPPRSQSIFASHATQNQLTIEQTRTFFKENYGITEDDIYAQLPPTPASFQNDVNTLHYGNGISIGQIPLESYRQPEFYPTFSTSGIKTWATAPATLPNTIGIASTPAVQEAVLAPDTNGFSTTLFVGSAWGVTYYQGMGFRYRIQPAANIQLQFTPPHVLLGPTFPVFTPEWIHRITIDAQIPPEVPPGQYQITIYPASAPIEQQEKWYATHSRYINGDGIITPSEGLATLTLTIPQ